MARSDALDNNALAAALRSVGSLGQGGSAIAPLRINPYQPGEAAPYQGGPRGMLSQAQSHPGGVKGGGGGGRGSAIGAGLEALGKVAANQIKASKDKQAKASADLAAADALAINKPSAFGAPPNPSLQPISDKANNLPSFASGGPQNPSLVPIADQPGELPSFASGSQTKAPSLSIADQAHELPIFAENSGASHLPNIGKTQELPTFAAGDGGSYLARLKSIENPSGNPHATSSTGATGTFQFLPSTWKRYGGGGDIHGDQTDALMRFTADNEASLTQALGRAPTAGELYLAHQQGAGGAAKLLANPDATPKSLGLGHAVSVNNGNPNAPASDFIEKWTGRFKGIPSPFGESAARPIVQPVIPGQGDPHRPGFDAGSVNFHDYSQELSPAPGPQGQLNTISPINQVASAQTGDSGFNSGSRKEQEYFTNPIHEIPPGSPEMPKSLSPPPERQFPQGPGNLGVADNGAINPLALALMNGLPQTGTPVTGPTPNPDMLAMSLMNLQQPNFGSFLGGIFG